MTPVLVPACLVALATAMVVTHPGDRALAGRGLGLRRPYPTWPDARAVGDGVRRRWIGRRRAAARRAGTIEFCRAVAAELHAGAVSTDAIERAAGSVPEIADLAARAARLGGDVAAALALASREPGAHGLAPLGAAWAVSQQSGAGLADACDAVAEWLVEDEAIRREVASQLAATRASARLLAVLPLFGLALGAGLGARPLDVLFGTRYGWACLVLGGALTVAGLWWVGRLSRSIEERV